MPSRGENGYVHSPNSYGERMRVEMPCGTGIAFNVSVDAEQIDISAKEV